jgi:ribonuclease BN (tRNA processing enzyme)
VHYVPAFAMRIETGDDGVIGYSADTAPCDAVAELVRGAQLFLCEAALGPSGREQGERGHLNAGEAGELARRARAEHLVITHYNASARPSDLRAAARRAFSGTVTVADDGMTFALQAKGQV